MEQMQVTRQAKVDCPRCHRTLTAHEGISEVDCVCHTWCQYGEKASDCDLLQVQSRSKTAVRVAANSDDCDVYEVGAAHPPWDTLNLAPTTMWMGKSGIYYGHGTRYLDVQIPSTATINDARIIYTCDYTRTDGTVYLKIDGEDADNAITFSNIADYNARTRTTASVTWSMNADTPWTKGTEYATPNLATIIQEIIDRAGWTTGNSIVLFVEDVGGTSTTYRRGEEHDVDPKIAPQLRIEWTPLGVKSTTPTQLGWPFNLHNDDPNEGDDILHRTYYCNTHSVYSYKVPLTIEVDWSGKRAKRKHRMSKGLY